MLERCARARPHDSIALSMRPPGRRLTNQEAPMSKLARTLVLGAMLAAMNLASMTAGAQAQANDPDGKDARRPPTQGQVGEAWRKRPVKSQQQIAADAALRRQLAQEHSYRSSETPAQAQANNEGTPTQRELDERWSYYYQSTRIPPAELKARMQAQARSDTSTQPPAQVPAPVPYAPSGQPGWLVPSLGVLVAALALVAGVAVMAAERANRL
jgi:hypothetical protein